MTHRAKRSQAPKNGARHHFARASAGVRSGRTPAGGICETGPKLPEVVVSHASMLWNHTGSWRYIRPRYLNKVPPCNQGCPAGNDVEGFIRLIQDGKYADAWMVIKEDNPFPKVCGRVCYHPCETACNRAQFDRAVAINLLERLAGDHSPKNFKIPKHRKNSGKKVCIIGSGPAGLTAAYHLARMGHGVTIYEMREKPGGMLRYGIPEYRLPKKILDEEIADVTGLGVEIKCNRTLGKEIDWKDLKHFDAVFVAVGAHESRKLGVEGEDAEGVMTGLGFLEKMVRGAEGVDLGSRTVVIGGGNTAVDAARSAMRLGSRVTILYQRSRSEMPAYAEEVEEAEKEGAVLNILTRPVKIIEDHGRVVGIQMIRTRLGEPDKSGRRRPEPVPGSEFIVQANTIITAIGESSELQFLPKDVQVENGRILIDKFGLSKHPGIFAGGDAAMADHNVAVAIGSGRAAAVAMDNYLRGQDSFLSPSDILSPASPTAVPFSEINLNYFEKTERSKATRLKITERDKNFNEVQKGLTDEAARRDAERCFHCGVCTMCDNCYTFCPDVAIVKLGGDRIPSCPPRTSLLRDDRIPSCPPRGYNINLDYCKGCGVCVHECPRSAMVMEEET